MILIDMHLHSVCSDGVCTAEELARKAKARGLSLVSLTDHDTTAGLSSFLRACRRRGVPALTGVELSAGGDDFTLHILGYRIDPADAGLAAALARQRLRRGERNAVICEKLSGLGLGITIEEVGSEANGEVAARPHIAEVMRKKGYVGSIREAFDKYIGHGRPAYVPCARMNAEECIAAIRSAGGLAVLAHPLQAKLTGDGLDRLAARLGEAGLWGIETVYPGHSPEQIFNLMKLADKYGLYSTAGSDFHGFGSGGAEPGMPVGEDFLPWARLSVR